ncbi:MAG TPA: LysR substrate-binding domain-containing protein [Candidatus Avamphibacillus sp.]|nr:LysR substrate-binding domain-containing protein [Candidatus Avamphibacillus sp.]
MELRQLEYFMTVCKTLHFTQAAEELYISQPSLSQQIKKLEFEVGTPLFDRIGKKTALTEAGKILLAHSQRIFHELEQAEAAIRDLNGLERGNLTLGALLTCVNYLLPPAIVKFKQLYPNIELSVLGLKASEIHEKLHENELDLGIAFLPIIDEDLESIPLFTEELSLAVPLNHPFANRKEVEMEELKDAQMILLPESYFLRKLIDTYCLEIGLTLKPTLEMTTMESLIQMVSEGVGVTILPSPYLDSLKNNQIVKVNLANPTPQREIGFIYRKEKFMCQATKTFISQVTDASKSVTEVSQVLP